MADPGEVDSGLVRAGDEVGEGAAGEVGSGDALAHVTAAPGITADSFKTDRPDSCSVVHAWCTDSAGSWSFAR